MMCPGDNFCFFVVDNMIMLSFFQLNKKSTLSYLIISYMMIITFFFSRLMVFPYLYHCYASYSNISILHVPQNIPVKCNISCLLLLIPQLYWFSLMIKGLIKRWKEKTSEQNIISNNRKSKVTSKSS